MAKSPLEIIAIIECASCHLVYVPQNFAQVAHCPKCLSVNAGVPARFALEERSK